MWNWICKLWVFVSNVQLHVYVYMYTYVRVCVCVCVCMGRFSICKGLYDVYHLTSGLLGHWSGGKTEVPEEAEVKQDPFIRR